MANQENILCCLNVVGSYASAKCRALHKTGKVI